MIDRRCFMAGAAGVALSGAATYEPLARSSKISSAALTPEMFGAKGDGVADDSAAFAALAGQINEAGGGTIVMRKTTYLVARRDYGPVQWLSPAPLLKIVGCRHAVRIMGNNARIRCASRQRYGVFTPDGAPFPKNSKKRVGAKTVSPYEQMILVRDCSGDIEISDLELDGNLAGHQLGGGAGDKGWQIFAVGIKLVNNLGAETLRNIHCHHHALDGIYLDGIDADTKPERRLIGIHCDSNGRQGMSIVGGRGYSVIDSTFTRTGRAGIKSAPAAGVDIEAEHGKKIRRLHFINCRFEGNSGVGMVADTGNSADVRFDDCTFIGTYNWAIWADKPNFEYRKCLFAGSIVHPYSNADPAIATHFLACTFRDDPKLSSNGKLTLRKNLIADLPRATNVLFDHCQFQLDHDGVLPWSKGAIYKDCVMSQKSRQVAHTRGIFKGTNRITGRVNISRSPVEGTLLLNGKRIE